MKTPLVLLVFLALVSAGGLAAQTPADLFSVAREGTVDEVKAAIARGESLTQVQSSDGLTPLLFAVRYNTPEVAQVLIDAGSSLTTRDAAGMSALFNALQFNPDLKMTELMIRAGNKLVDRDALGGTAPMRAILNPNPEVFRFVMRQKGMTVNDKDRDGVSTLAWAVGSGSLEMVQTLMKAGANVQVKDNQGISLLMVAAGSDTTGEKLALLLQAGVKLEATDNRGETAFQIAATKPNLTAAKILVAAGAKVTVRDNEGATALMLAALFNTNPEAVPYLLSLGIELNAVDRNNQTALNWADGNQNPEVRAALKAAGAVASAPPPPVKVVSPLPEGTWLALSDATLAEWKNDRWEPRPGSAYALAQGRGAVWSLGTEAVVGGYPLRRWTGNEWQDAGVGGRKVAVGADGQPWVVTADQEIRHLVRENWETVSGKATDIAVGADGTVWTIGVTATGENFDIRRWDGKKWVAAPGAAVQIAVDPKGSPWVINAGHKVYRMVKGAWSAVDLWGARALGIGRDGTVVLVLNENAVEPQFSVLDGKVLYLSGGIAISLP